MNQLYILLLALWSAFNPSDAGDPDTTQDPWQTTTESHQTLSTVIYPMVSTEEDPDFGNTWISDEYEPVSDKPNITVYRQIEDREQVIVLFKPAETEMTHSWQYFELSVESELSYNIERLHIFPFYSEINVFLVTVRPPASFTCVQETDSDLGVRTLRSQTYNYSLSVSDHHEEGASLLYICFSSFIAVGLFIMTAAVIVINIRSKTKDTNSTVVTDNEYVEA